VSTNSRSQQNIPEGEEQKSEKEFKINVARLLNDCAEGKMIINNYKSRKPESFLILSEQKTICKLILDIIVSNRLSPGRKDLRSIAEQIVRLFPGELVDFYVKKGSGGILANKVINRIERIRINDPTYPSIIPKMSKCEQ
jgi:hypothetical protein